MPKPSADMTNAEIAKRIPILIGMGLVWLFTGCSLRDAWHARSLVSISGTVVSSSWPYNTRRDKYPSHLTYQFNVDGVVYEGSRLRRVAYSTFPAELTKEQLQQLLRPGAVISVRYNPSDPHWNWCDVYATLGSPTDSWDLLPLSLAAISLTSLGYTSVLVRSLYQAWRFRREAPSSADGGAG